MHKLGHASKLAWDVMLPAPGVVSMTVLWVSELVLRLNVREGMYRYSNSRQSPWLGCSEWP